MADSFVLYTNYIDQIELLDDAQRGRLLTAIFAHAAGQDIPDLDGITSMCYSFIASQMDRDKQKYDETVEKRRKAGRKGGQAKASNTVEEEAIPNNAKQSQAKEANASFAKQSQAKEANASFAKHNDNDNDNVIDTVNDTDNVNVNDNVIDTVNDTDNVIKRKGTNVPKRDANASPKRKRFVPPLITQVESYCEEKGYQMDCQAFMDYYTSNGWKVGKNSMKDWKAAVRNWVRRDKKTYSPPPRGHTVFDEIMNS